MNPYNNRPKHNDRTIKALLAVIALALVAIALRPLIAPVPAQARAGEQQGASIANGNVAIYGYQHRVVIVGKGKVSGYVIRHDGTLARASTESLP
jgi:hypothetical protein